MRLNHLTLLLSFLLFCSCTKPTGDVLPQRSKKNKSLIFSDLFWQN